MARKGDVHRGEEATKEDRADGVADGRLRDGERGGGHVDNGEHNNVYTDSARARTRSYKGALPQIDIRVSGQG